MLKKQRIDNLYNREDPQLYIKFKRNESKSNVVQQKQEKEYEYYICDFCKEEIIIKKDRHKQEGGIVILPDSITNRGEIKVVLHNRCLNPLLKELEQEE